MILSADTNLFLYAANPDSPHHEAARFFEEEIVGERLLLCGLVLVEIGSLLYAGQMNLGLRSFDKCRWPYIGPDPSFALLNDTVFPWLQTLKQRVGPAQNGNTTLGRLSGRLSVTHFATAHAKHFAGFGLEKAWNAMQS